MVGGEIRDLVQGLHICLDWTGASTNRIVASPNCGVCDEMLLEVPHRKVQFCLFVSL